MTRAVGELQAALAAIEGDAALWEEAEEGAFARRSEALDELEVHAIGRAEALLALGPPASEARALRALRGRAERLARRLAAADARLLRRLRAEVRAGGHRGAGLAALFEAYAPGRLAADEEGYDLRDALLNGLLGLREIPVESYAPEPELVSYQQTPARVALELAGRLRLGPGDLFVDIGSGLGHVPIVAHLVTGARAMGVEREPAYCAQARACAAALRLQAVTFACEDARAADYAGAAAAFMYTPLVGGALRETLGRLREAARARPLRLFTYGPCTAQAAREPWLVAAGPAPAGGLAEYMSV
jgi:hypothetical protein